MSKYKVSALVTGASGRMGQALLKIFPEYQINPAVALTRAPSVNGYKSSVNILDKAIFKKVDVVIDFSTPEIFMQTVAMAAEHQIPVVSGTTGLQDMDHKRLRQFAKKTAILWAPNMSPGMAVFRRALKSFSGISHFDFQIEEVHHKRKKDSPSGTAKIIWQDLEEITGKKISKPLSVRAGGVVGEHKVSAYSENEKIELYHQVFDRTVFASGAALAAIWILNKKRGLFSIEDAICDG